MAVRTDFTPGEVLAAADLNDTFGAKANSASPTFTGTMNVSAVTGGLPTVGRNLLYNGAMQVAQRGTSVASITATSYNTVDRWQAVLSSLGTWTQSVENDAPTGSGFRKSLKMLCTTANASPASGSYAIVSQRLEGQDLQRIAKGTASAQQLTLSFWVKANATGTYVVEMRDTDNVRIACASYTISASATWEKKTITFPADTTGAFDNDNGLSLEMLFWLGAGSNFTSGTLQTTWAADVTANRAVGQTNLAAATNNYWQVTGVQLEIGPVATSFEFKSYGQELRECQRYYFRYSNGGANVSGRIPGVARASSATVGVCTIPFPQQMRDRPSAVEFSSIKISDDVSFDSGNCTLTIGPERSLNATLLSIATTAAAALSGLSIIAAGSSAYLGLTAEL